MARARREILDVAIPERETQTEPNACRMIAGGNWWRQTRSSGDILPGNRTRAIVRVTRPRRSLFLNRAEPRQSYRYFDCRRTLPLTLLLPTPPLAYLKTTLPKGLAD